MDYRKYTYQVIWSEEDQEYVGLCAEFPSLSWLDASQEKAFNGILNTVADVVADMEENGEILPKADAAGSSELVIHITPERRKALSLNAARAGISLNSYINEILNA